MGKALLITDPPPISFTTLSEKRKKRKKLHVTHDMWHVTRDMWNVTCDTWHMACDMWHVTCDMLWGVTILSKCQLPSFYRLWFMILWRSGGKGWLAEWMNEWINDEQAVTISTTTFLIALRWDFPDRPIPVRGWAGISGLGQQRWTNKKM